MAEKTVMKATYDNQRQENNEAGAKHNDRTMNDEQRKRQDHIDESRTDLNKCFTRVEGHNMQVEQRSGELASFEYSYYSGTYHGYNEKQKEKYRANRQKKRADECTISKMYNNKQTGPQKTLLQVGAEGEYTDKEKFEKMCFELADYYETQKGEDYRHIVLSLSFHYDETSIHCHMNHIYEVKDENGNWKPAKDEFREKMGVKLPKESEKKSKKNNRAQVQVKADRDKWYSIIEEIDKDISIDREPEKKKAKQMMDHTKGKAIQQTNEAIERSNKAVKEMKELETKAAEQKEDWEAFQEWKKDSGYSLINKETKKCEKLKKDVEYQQNRLDAAKAKFKDHYNDMLKDVGKSGILEKRIKSLSTVQEDHPEIQDPDDFEMFQKVALQIITESPQLTIKVWDRIKEMKNIKEMENGLKESKKALLDQVKVAVECGVDIDLDDFELG